MAPPGLSTHLEVGPARISFQRVPRISHDAPPAPVRSHGVLPVALVSPSTALVPVADEEGVWLGLESAGRAPCALRVLIRDDELEDAVTGLPPEDTLSGDPQNYVVVPVQHWLEGAAADGTCARPFVRVAHTANQAAVQEFEFVAVALREGFRPRSGRPREMSAPCSRPGFVQQVLQPDPYGVDAWDHSAVTRMRVRLLSTGEYRYATGLPAPPPLDPGSAYGGWRLP